MLWIPDRDRTSEVSQKCQNKVPRKHTDKMGSSPVHYDPKPAQISDAPFSIWWRFVICVSYLWIDPRNDLFRWSGCTLVIMLFMSLPRHHDDGQRENQSEHQTWDDCVEDIRRLGAQRSRWNNGLDTIRLSSSWNMLQEQNILPFWYIQYYSFDVWCLIKLDG